MTLKAKRAPAVFVTAAHDALEAADATLTQAVCEQRRTAARLLTEMSVRPPDEPNRTGVRCTGF